jgi:hypothetical protein
MLAETYQYKGVFIYFYIKLLTLDGIGVHLRNLCIVTEIIWQGVDTKELRRIQIACTSYLVL